MYTIRHIFASEKSNNLFVTAEYDEKVTIWSLKNKTKINEIKTNLDFGGERVLIIEEPNPIVITGSYDKYGVTAYNALNGKKLWERKDLKKNQFLTIIKEGNKERIGVGFDKKPFELLELETGKTLKKYEDVSKIFKKNESSVAILKMQNKLKIINLKNDENVFENEISFENLILKKDGYILNTQYSIISFNNNNQCEWEYKVPKNHIIHKLSWNEKTSSCLFVMWNYEEGGSKILGKIDKKGCIFEKNQIGEIWEQYFMDSGKLIITSNGEVLSTEDLNIKWKFCDKYIEK